MNLFGFVSVFAFCCGNQLCLLVAAVRSDLDDSYNTGHKAMITSGVSLGGDAAVGEQDAESVEVKFSGQAGHTAMITAGASLDGDSATGGQDKRSASVEFIANHTVHKANAMLDVSTKGANSTKHPSIDNLYTTADTAFLILVIFLVAAGGVGLLWNYLCYPCLMRKGKNRNQHIVKGRVVYEWAQSASLVTFYTMPPPGTDESRVQVTISPSRLTIGRIGKSAVMDHELFAEIDNAASTWKMSALTGELEISLRKVQEVDWPCIFKKDQQFRAGQKHLPAIDSAQ